MSFSNLVSTLIILAILLQGALSVNYEITDKVPQTPGGARFENEIGVPYTEQIMGTINQFIYDIFEQNDPNDRRQQDVVKLFIDEYKGAEAITVGEIVNVSSIYLQGYQGDIKWEFTSLLYHEITHVFQWCPPDAPNGLVEGVADYVKLKAHYDQVGFAKPGQGDSWDQGYDFTARFLEYCESLSAGFVAQLNKKMRDSFNVNYFVDLLGKPVDELWKEYKDKYSKNVRRLLKYKK